MKGSERREQLLQIMSDIRSQADAQADFTIEMIAERAKISTVRVYRLIGTEFKEVRGNLPGPRRSPSTVVSDLRQENERLRKEFTASRTQDKEDFRAEYEGALLLITTLDEDNRRLRSYIEILERRLKDEAFVVVEISATGKSEEKNKVGPRLARS